MFRLLSERTCARTIRENGGFACFHDLNPFRLEIVRLGVVEDLPLLTNLKHLRCIELRGMGAVSEVLKVVLKANPRLETLLLSDTDVDESVLDYISTMSALTFLDIRRTKIGSDSAEHFIVSNPHCLVFYENTKAEELKRVRSLFGIIN